MDLGTPISIKRLPATSPESPAGMEVTWSSGATYFLAGDLLRRSCPCATCAEKRGAMNHAKPLASPRRSLLRIVESAAEEEGRLDEIWPIGNYAVGIRWGDHHDTGIYSFDLLRSLCALTTTTQTAS